MGSWKKKEEDGVLKQLWWGLTAYELLFAAYGPTWWLEHELTNCVDNIDIITRYGMSSWVCVPWSILKVIYYVFSTLSQSPVLVHPANSLFLSVTSRLPVKTLELTNCVDNIDIITRYGMSNACAS
jgi:hypothetical protein